MAVWKWGFACCSRKPAWLGLQTSTKLRQISSRHAIQACRIWETSRPLTGHRLRKLMCLRQATHASRFRTPDIGLARKIPEMSQDTCAKPFASFDQASQSWKTFPDTSGEDSPEFSGRWPRWGLLRDGIVYELPKPAHLTDENAFSVLPTPRTTDSQGPGKHGEGGDDLRTSITWGLVQRPSSSSYGKPWRQWRHAAPGHSAEGRPWADTGGSSGMGTEICVTLPTPAARDSRGIDKRRTLLEAKVISIGANTSPL